MQHGWVIACVAAVVTGAFGGVLRDLLCNRIPLVFRKELYASISFLSTCIYIGLQELGLHQNVVVVLTLILGFGLRLLAIRFKLGLPIFEFDEAQYLGKGDLLDRLSKRKK